ncbi:unnamed protein product [Ophioblennius macclurei]
MSKGKGKPAGSPLARRPDNSAFKQQRLPAWSPMLSAGTVLPFFYLTAVVTLLLGVWLLVTVQSTQEMKIDYTEGDCAQCFEMREDVNNANKQCSCTLKFTVEKEMKGDVFFYYGLRNFHQNLRRYMDSRDDGQTFGRAKNLKSPSSYCVPFDKDKDGKPIAPCGAVANSIFNDSFTVTFLDTNVARSVPVPLHRRGISWYTDKNIKFRNPRAENMTLQQAFNGTVRPPYWQKSVYELDLMDESNNGFINDDLIIWMREAAFPNFKKLYGVLNRAHPPFTAGLPVGNYTIDIKYNFPVQHFRGRKEVVLTTLTWFGGQNHFLPVAYLVTSLLILLMAVGLTVVWVKFGKNGKNMEE